MSKKETVKLKHPRIHLNLLFLEPGKILGYRGNRNFFLPYEEITLKPLGDEVYFEAVVTINSSLFGKNKSPKHFISAGWEYFDD